MGGDGEEQEDALHLKSLSETTYKSGDIPSALRYAHRALRISPSLPGIRPLLSSLRILSHCPREDEDSSPPDYYAILQLDPFSQLDAVRRQYKALALALHPDKNPSFVCQDAFKVVADALRVLSDAEEKERYDLRLRVRMQEEGLGQAGSGSGSGGEGRFWSRCRECGKLHEFDKGYSGKRLICSGCGKSFKAVGVGDGSGSESEATDEDAGIVAPTEASKKMGGVDGAVGGRDVIYVRRRKGSDNKVGEDDATQIPSRDVGGGLARDGEVREKDVYRRGKDARSVYGEGTDREFETVDEEEEGFWDLTLKDGLSKQKIADASAALKLMNDGEKHKVQSRNGRKEVKSGKKRVLRDVEEKKPVVVIGLRCIADDGRLKISESSAKLHIKKHQSPEVDMGGGRSEWGWSRQRSQRVQVESVEESTQKSDEEEDVSGEEVMTLAEMRSRLSQKVSSDKEKSKKKDRENKKEKVGEKPVGVEDKNDHERVMEQVINDKEEEQENNDRDVDDENELEDGEEERENMGVLEESGGWGDVEMEMMNVRKDEDDQQEDLEKEKEQEEGTVVVVNNTSQKGKGNRDQEADATGIMPSSRDESLENGTWGNGDVVEETAASTKWTKRIRCYESKRHPLSKRDKDSGVKILGTSGTLNRRLSSGRERPISTKSRIPRHLDSEFYDFNVDRGERKFKKGQVWAIYDEFGRPRRYGLIDEVLSTNPFAVRLKWLAKQETKGQDSSTSCAGCGRFKVTTFAVVKSIGMFSHEVDGERVAREMYDIYPKKGSVWAIYGGRQSLELQDVVICLTTYTEGFGLSMGYLEEIEGFRTVYKRKDIGWDAVRWLGKDEISLLSHQIPARRLLHDVVSDFKEDCWVLDPASISSVLPT